MFDARRADWFSLAAGAVIWFSGVVATALDFTILQGMVYRFDLVSLAGLVLGLLGHSIRLQARRTLRVYFSGRLRTLPEHQLIRYGIYKHIRHPAYLGTLVAYPDVPVFFHSLYGFFVMMLIIPLVVLHRIPTEERMLIDKFGDQYRDYMKSSKKLIPYVY